jgi:hypothetical protein
MISDSDIQKLKSDYPEFFKKIPPKLLEFILSNETTFKIAEICSEAGIEDEEKIEKIAYIITLVLLNQVPKESFIEILMKGVGLDFNTASRISQKAEELIFSQAPKIEIKEILKERKIPTIGEILGLRKTSKEDK